MTLLAFLVLLFVAQPAKGPGADSYSTQINTTQEKDTTRSDSNNKLFPTTDTKTQINNYTKTEKSDNPSDDEKGSSDLGTWMIVCGTWALAIIGYFQYRKFTNISEKQLTQSQNASVNQLSVMRETMERQLRAYISVAFAKNPETGVFAQIINRGPSQSTIAKATFVLTNSGNTPAYGVTAIICIEPGEKDRTEFPLETTDEAVPSFTIHAGESVPIATRAEKPITVGQMRAVAKGEMNIFFWGKISYKDAFKKPKWTSFRLVCKWSNHQLGSPVFCPEGNETEET